MLTMLSFEHHQKSWIHRRNAHRAPAPRRPAFRPRIEGLEERTVLSTLTVLNTLDKGAGSLRDTITSAKSGDTIATVRLAVKKVRIPRLPVALLFRLGLRN
jgi:hypothetical protein